MSATTIGGTAVTLTETGLEIGINSGERWTQVYRGPYAAAAALYESLKTSMGTSVGKDQVRIRRSRGIGTVEVQEEKSYGEQESGSAQYRVWEVLPFDLEKDIHQFPGRLEDGDCPKFNLNADQAAIRLAEVEWLEKANANYTPVNANAVEFLKLLKLGAANFRRTGIMLQCSFAATSRSSIKASWLGVDRAHTIDETFPLGPQPPTDIIGQLSELPDYDATKKQWLKGGPGVRRSRPGRYDISYRWLFATRWSYAYYGGDNEDGNP